MKKTALILSVAAISFAGAGCSADKSGDTQQMPASASTKKPPVGPPGVNVPADVANKVGKKGN